MDITINNRIRGSLLAGAIGDALGAPTEFMSLEQIRSAHGEEGVTDYIEMPPDFTDDTQMMLFTAEGLVRHKAKVDSGEDSDPVQEVYLAYLRWLRRN